MKNTGGLLALRKIIIIWVDSESSRISSVIKWQSYLEISVLFGNFSDAARGSIKDIFKF